MEFLICMLLASLVTGGRLAVDGIHAAKGTDPAHLQKARLRAQAAPKAKGRSSYADGKPRVRDVAAVYWGDAMADVIAGHDRRRGEKQARRDAKDAGETVPAGPSLKDRAKRMGSLIWNGPQRAATEPGTPTAGPETADRPVIACDECGAPYLRTNRGFQHPQDSFCSKARPSPRSKRGDVVHDSNHYKMARNHCWECRKCGAVGLDHATRQAAEAAHQKHHCDPSSADPDASRRLHAAAVEQNDPDRSDMNSEEAQAIRDAHASRLQEEHRVASEAQGRASASGDRDAMWAQEVKIKRIESEMKRDPTYDRALADTDAQTGNHEWNKASEAAAGNAMASLSAGRAGAGAAAGEVANYETAMAELDRLEEAQGAHLEQAQAALEEIRDAKQRISDTQATYRPAAEAAGHIHESLNALSLDQETVANTGTITDAMPPNEVDIMFNQLEDMEARAQQQVTNAEIAIAATQQARQVILAKYGDANATVQGELSGDSRFLSASSV